MRGHGSAVFSGTSFYPAHFYGNVRNFDLRFFRLNTYNRELKTSE
jgi:hypothetical protein